MIKYYTVPQPVYEYTYNGNPEEIKGTESGYPGILNIGDKYYITPDNKLYTKDTILHSEITVFEIPHEDEKFYPFSIREGSEGQVQLASTQLVPLTKGDFEEYMSLICGLINQVTKSPYEA